MACQIRPLSGPQGQDWHECARCRKIYTEVPPPERQFCIGDPPLIIETPVAPSLASRTWDLVASLAAFVCDGCQLVSKDEYAARLTVCDSCLSRKGNWCRACGCHLSLKAKGRAFRCPEGKWPENTA